MKTLYLNNAGSKWKNFYEMDGKPEQIELETTSGKKVQRVVIFWESFGNYSLATINYKGKNLEYLLILF